jgi:DNA-binding transcriptional ArsR family regulator
MADTDMLAQIAGLLGEPARTRILNALLGGCALTAKELAYFAGVTPATASSHLSRLVGGRLLVMVDRAFLYSDQPFALVHRCLLGGQNVPRCRDTLGHTPAMA